MNASPFVLRLVLLAGTVSALFAASALLGVSPTTSVEIGDVRPYVADWCEDGEYVEVDVRVRLVRRARNWCYSSTESWLAVEFRTADGWERAPGGIFCGTGLMPFELPAGTDVTWAELVKLDPADDRQRRFVLDVPRASRFQLFDGRLSAASETFRPSELLARVE